MKTKITLARPFRVVAILLSSALLLSACSLFPRSKDVQPDKPLRSLSTAYDYQLLGADLKPLRLRSLVKQLASRDVIFIGEWHDNHASHLLQMRLLERLYTEAQKSGRELVLSMEMFNRDRQAVLNRYLKNEVGERRLINDAEAWSNYIGSYRPLVEFARENQIPVLAANAPSAMVHCIGRLGKNYIDQLDAAEKPLLAKQPFADVLGYKSKFVREMGGSAHVPENQLDNSYLAQLARDNTMAETIVAAKDAKPNLLVVHINGSFHSEDFLGTAGAVRERRPEFSIAVVTPLARDRLDSLSQTQRHDGEFYYLANPAPAEFVDESYRKQVIGKMFTDARLGADSCQKPSHTLTF
ncbi:ChaN family lipoprotein [Spongiibacter sp. KMU-158]|uniref:ChaN family lipoprotein n=1 Tax=Spongiibacter pelagi TaxID=2760804 RepID=A0A927C081_9GAMM|nr:ChaN family lipoprotein [Spongiibacter pelagi]MBD2857487.1 ChaN family lipoprotein [Spongiibacter pelagi]